jgi:hypothetical protein
MLASINAGFSFTSPCEVPGIIANCPKGKASYKEIV